MKRIVNEYVTPGKDWPGTIPMVDYLRQEGVINAHEYRVGKRRSWSERWAEKLGLTIRHADAGS